MNILPKNCGVEIVAGGATAPAASIVTAVPYNGDSFSIRQLTSVKLFDFRTAFNNAANTGSFARIRSNYLHDPFEGIRIVPFQNRAFRHDFSNTMQTLNNGDTLTVELQSSAGAGLFESVILCYYYEDITLSSMLATLDEVKQNAVNWISQDIQIVQPTVIGWGAQTNLLSIFNTSTARIKGNKWYAIVGMEINSLSTPPVARLKFPGSPFAHPLIYDVEGFSANYYEYFSREFNIPMFPVIRGLDFGNSFVELLSPNTVGLAPRYGFKAVELCD